MTAANEPAKRWGKSERVHLGPLEFKATWDPKYEVSRCGEIRNSKSGRILKLVNSGDGYKLVTFSNGSKRETVRVHKAVAFAFLGPRPSGFEINHIDGDKLNNQASNLEYVTGKGNYEHAIRTKLKVAGPNRKLSAEQVKYIRTEWDSRKISAKQLASKFGVDWSSIYNAKRGSTWS